MKAWMRYGIVAAFAVWLLGLAPAFVFMPHYRSHGGELVSYAIWWAFAPLFATVGAIVIGVARLMWPSFTTWLRGQESESERLRRIEELEREVGIR